MNIWGDFYKKHNLATPSDRSRLMEELCKPILTTCLLMFSDVTYDIRPESAYNATALAMVGSEEIELRLAMWPDGIHLTMWDNSVHTIPGKLEFINNNISLHIANIDELEQRVYKCLAQLMNFQQLWNDYYETYAR